MNLVEVKTSELKGPALDWAVAKAEGFETQLDMEGYYDTQLGREVTTALYLGSANVWEPSTHWDQGGPLIEQHNISVIKEDGKDECAAYIDLYVYYENWDYASSGFGPTPLIAACRAIVAAKLGNVVTVPKELLS